MLMMLIYEGIISLRVACLNMSVKAVTYPSYQGQIRGYASIPPPRFMRLATTLAVYHRSEARQRN